MFQYVAEWAMAKAGEKVEGAAPTTYELAAIHFLYLLPLFHLLQAGLRYFSPLFPPLYSAPILPHIGIENFIFALGALVSVTVIFMIWTIQFRKTRIDAWITSHLLWLFKAYYSLALSTLFAVVAYAVLILLVFVIKPLAALLIFGIPLLVLCAGGLFLLRIIRGYLAFLKKKPVAIHIRKRRLSGNLGEE